MSARVRAGRPTGNAGQGAGLRAGRAFGRFLRFPRGGLRRGVTRGGIAEHVRMAADHLVGDRPGHVGEREQPGFLGHAGVVDDLEQQVAEFVGQRREVVARDRVGDLIGFLDGVGRDGSQGLHLVPGAAGDRVAQRGHDVEQAAKFVGRTARFLLFHR